MSGAVRQPAIRTLGFAEFKRLAPPARPSGNTRVEFLDDGKIARLVIPSLVYGPDRKKTEEVFDQAFDQIRKRASTDLIIDIRGNSGGDSRMGDYVLRFVRPKQSARPESFFTGKTYMLTDHIVFSSAVIFADAFRDCKVGTIVGYETGGTPSHYGQPRAFTLENSGIAFGVSSKHFNAPKPRPGDADHGVLPDVAVNRELLVPFRKEADPVLAFTLAHIRENRKNPRR
jgi:C-terminal processing protease CtpA/Prc